MAVLSSYSTKADPFWPHETVAGGPLTCADHHVRWTAILAPKPTLTSVGQPETWHKTIHCATGCILHIVLTA